MMIDSFYRTEKLCGELSLDEYETALQETFNDKNIVVRITKTLNNDTGIAIGYLSKELITQLRESAHAGFIFGMAANNDLGHEQPMRYVAVSLANFSVLHAYLSWRYLALDHMKYKTLTKNCLAAFTKIYTALRDGQQSLLKKNFLLSIESTTDEIAKDSIEANIKRNPNSRTAVAWRLAETHRTNCNDENQVLLKEIYKFCFEKSTALSKSSLSGTSLWRSSKVNKALEEKDITPEDRDGHSRSGKIATALKPPKK